MMYILNKYKIIAQILVVWAILSNVSIGISQNMNTTSSVITNRLKKANLELPYTDNIKFYNSKNLNLPFVEDLRLRAESDRFGFGTYRYQARLKFNSSEQRRAQSKLIGIEKSEFDTRQDLYILYSMQSTYFDILTWYVADKSLKLQKEEKIILEDKKLVYKKLLETGQKFDINDWLNNQNKIQEVSSDINYYQSKMEELRKYLLIQNNTGLQFDNWVSIESIKLIVSDVELSRNDPRYVINKLKEVKSKSRLEREKAKGKQWLDFVQLEYKPNDKFDINREISLGASFSIPFKSTNRIKINEAQVSILENISKTNLQLRKRKLKIERILANLNRNIKAYEDLIRFIQQNNIQETYDAYIEMGTISPLVLLEIKELLLSNELKILEIEEKIYEDYIELLSVSGKIVDLPLKNYLSDDFSSIN